MQWLAIALGGGLGAMARFAAVAYLTPLLGYRFPVGTFAVNIIGSLIIGAAYVFFVEKTHLAPEWRLFFITGLLGGFTTFSSFSLELLQLWQEGNMLLVLAYAASSVVLGLLMAYVGMALAQKFF
jgi:fluoride exporter